MSLQLLVWKRHLLNSLSCAHITNFICLQIRAQLFQTLTTQLADAAKHHDGINPKVLSAMASLASLPSSSDTEQWVASCANQYKYVAHFHPGWLCVLFKATCRARIKHVPC
jgi:hypothetical protein